MKKPIVAIMYDFDKTLITRDMQEYTFIPSLGMQPDDFWAGTQMLASEQQMDSVLTYMYAMMIRAEANGKPLKREDLVECGQHVVYLPGVEDWFERINEYGNEAGVEVEHYVLSSGLKEIIDGTSIAKHFKKIFASEFLYGEDGKAVWAKMAVNYTNKTQFVYRINKGVLDISNNIEVNHSRKRPPSLFPQYDLSWRRTHGRAMYETRQTVGRTLDCALSRRTKRKGATAS